MKITAKAKIKSGESAKTLVMAFFEEFHPDSIISIKGYDANMEVTFEEDSPPKATVDAIFSCCESETIEFAYNAAQENVELPDKEHKEKMLGSKDTAEAEEVKLVPKKGRKNSDEKAKLPPKKKVLGRNEGLNYDLSQEEAIRKIVAESKTFSDFVGGISENLKLNEEETEIFLKAVDAAREIKENVTWSAIHDFFESKGWKFTGYQQKMLSDTFASNLSNITKCAMRPSTFIKNIVDQYGDYDFGKGKENMTASSENVASEKVNEPDNVQEENTFEEQNDSASVSEDSYKEETTASSENVASEEVNEPDNVQKEVTSEEQKNNSYSLTEVPAEEETEQGEILDSETDGGSDVEEDKNSLRKHFESMPYIPAFEKKLEEMDKGQPIKKKVKYILSIMGLAECKRDQREHILEIANVAVKEEIIDINQILDKTAILDQEKSRARMEFSEFVRSYVSKYNSECRVRVVDFLKDLKNIVS